MDNIAIDKATIAAVSVGAKLLHIHRFGDTTEKHVKQLLEWADFPLSCTVYDMGSGLGELSMRMSEYRDDIKFNLVNLSDEQIRLTPGTVKLDFTDTKLAKNSIGAAMYIFSIGHANHDKAIKEAARILKSGGILFIYDMIGDDRAMKELAEYSLLTNEEMQAIASNYGFKLTLFKLPHGDTTEVRSILGNDAFD